jgi:glycosyltransferase involved in cell wall biosynthesis
MDFLALAQPDDIAAANYVRSSQYFDTSFYLSALDDPHANIDPALHYVMVGEKAGLRPSASFDAAIYERLNPDVAATSINRLFHYENYGRSEGRCIAFQSDSVELDDVRLDEGKPTVILLLHEATYSGAPILGWNLLRELKLTRNVVVVLRRGGALQRALAEFATAVVGPLPQEVADNPVELKRLAERLKRHYKPLYGIANSVETRLFAIALRAEGLPIVALVHEFATHSPPYALESFYKICDSLVFPAEIVRQSSLEHYSLIVQRYTYILPQGPSDIPELKSAPTATSDPSGLEARGKFKLQAMLSQPNAPFTVIGLGAVDLRKGVDLFIAAATALKARHPDLPFRFIWLGDRVHPLPHTYYTFVDEQVARSGLEDQLCLAPAVDNLELIYDAADAFFLSSRLDPLPNVGIDATLRGIPLLCFKGATGFADLLQEDLATSWLLAPYMDTGAIADKLAQLALDPARRRATGAALRSLALYRFNMMRYAISVDSLGRTAAQRWVNMERQVETLLPEHNFDAQLYFNQKLESLPNREEAVRRYLSDTLNVDFSGDAAWGHHPRRALPGFHALIYGRLAPRFSEKDQLNPLVHFIANGRPPGPWSHEVIRLEDSLRPTASVLRSTLRVAIHGHFHYTDNFGDFLEAVEANSHPIDLLLTTTSDGAARVLRKEAEGFTKGGVSIDVMANLGRDIGPFITLLKDRLSAYDLVGHLHGKRSVHTLHYDPELGNRWRDFLWQHLIGPAVPVADIVIERFARDLQLGMVFPENDFLVGWERNRKIAASLAPRLGLGTLPEHIEFPVGTMFWARPQALQSLATAEFVAEEYPLEPLPIDGTMLHALERMIPLVVEAAGYRYATTYFPQFTR